MIRIDIVMKNLTSALRLILVQWKLRFSPEESHLKYVNATEGDFLKKAAEHANEVDPQDGYETITTTGHDDGTDFIFSFSLYAKTPWPPTVFPEGSGTLATVTFQATEMPSEPYTRIDLILFDIMMLDVDGNEIAYRDAEKGTYVAPIIKGDVDIDEKVNIRDIYIFGAAFGSYPGHPRWDSRADLTGDGKVNIIDGVIIAKAFHTS